MKQGLLLLLLLIFATALPVSAKTAPGYYITLNHDTVWVTFSISQFSAKSKPYIDLSGAGAALYYAEEGGRLMHLSPEEVLEIGATYKGHRMKKLARLHPGKKLLFKLAQYHNGYVFLDLHLEGLVKLMSYVEHNAKGMSFRFYMLQYDQEPLLLVDSSSFKEDMAQFFRDDADLVGKIENGEYRPKDLDMMVIEYNEKRVNVKSLEPKKEHATGF